MLLQNEALVLVADGSKMLILFNEGDATTPQLRVIEHEAFLNPANRDMLTDAPGVTHSREGPGRSTYDSGDPHQANEDRFAQTAAEIFAKAADSHAGELVVVAPPHALGVMRRHYSPQVRARLVAEIDKDLTGHSVADIARLISTQP
jgi:protein required for attachment to host cells